MKRLATLAILAGILSGCAGSQFNPLPYPDSKLNNYPVNSLNECNRPRTIIIGNDYYTLSPEQCSARYSVIQQQEKDKQAKQAKADKELHDKQAAQWEKERPQREAAERKAKKACMGFAGDLAAKYNVGTPASVRGQAMGRPNVYQCVIEYRRQNVYGITERHYAVFIANAANGQYEVDSFN